MSTKTYHGDLTTQDIASALVAQYDQGELEVQTFGDAQKLSVQIATRRNQRSGGQTALTVTLQAVEDGVLVDVGKQSWVKVAASLGQSVLAVARNPWNLLERLDDVAADVDVLQLDNKVWETIEKFASSRRASQQISERLRTYPCPYCDFGNEMGAGDCGNCGAPLGDAQPTACRHCGFVNEQGAITCASCKGGLREGAAAAPPATGSSGGGLVAAAVATVAATVPSAASPDRAPEPAPDTPTVRCRGCGTPHPKGTLFCSACSRPLPRR